MESTEQSTEQSSKQLEFNPDAEGPKYWKLRAPKFITNTDDIEQWKTLQDALAFTAGAWGIFAALLLTVGFAGLAVGTDSYNEENPEDTVNTAKFFYVGGFGICACSSFLAVLSGTLRYIYWVGVPPQMIAIAIENDHQLPPANFVHVAVISAFIGATAGVYLFFDADAFTEMVIIVLVTVIFVIIISVQNARGMKGSGMVDSLANAL